MINWKILRFPELSHRSAGRLGGEPRGHLSLQPRLELSARAQLCKQLVAAEQHNETRRSKAPSRSFSSLRCTNTMEEGSWSKFQLSNTSQHSRDGAEFERSVILDSALGISSAGDCAPVASRRSRTKARRVATGRCVARSPHARSGALAPSRLASPAGRRSARSALRWRRRSRQGWRARETRPRTRVARHVSSAAAHNRPLRFPRGESAYGAAMSDGECVCIRARQRAWKCEPSESGSEWMCDPGVALLLRAEAIRQRDGTAAVRAHWSRG